jgi:serine/threonine-protein kinase RsbW
VQEREHAVASTLQRSLLPDALPSTPGIDLTGRYQAGGAGLEIGGDWYDAVLRPDGILELCVGDVSGRGVGAATIMGRQRSTFRAYAYDCDSPGEVLRRMIRHVNEDEMITAACVTVDLLEGVLAYACAGHPPPLLLDRDSRTVTRLNGASSPPLGVAEAVDIVEQRLSLPSRVALALYTDGLVERRGESIEEGIDVLAQAISAGPEVSPEAALAAIGEKIGAPTDDVALLIACVEPAASFAIELPATPEILPGLRRRLRAWLAHHGLAEAAGEIVLAVSEALNNSIEHAYAEPGGIVRLAMSVDDGLLRVEVADRGRWQEPQPSDERGRGIMLMRSMMDNVEIDSDADGTRTRLARRAGGSREEPSPAPLTAAR